MAEEEHIVKLKGFSFDVTKKDIKDLYLELNIREKDINLLRYPDGRSTGYAFIRLKSANEVDQALSHNNRYLGSHFVSVTRSSLDEMTMIQSLVDDKKPIYVLRSAEAAAARVPRDRSPIKHKMRSPSYHQEEERNSPVHFDIQPSTDNYTNDDSNVVFMTGLPENKGYKEVRRFFSGCHISHGGVYLCMDGVQEGCVHNGSAYIEFADSAGCEMAKARDGCLIQDQCVSIKMCSRQELVDYLHAYPEVDKTGNWNGGKTERKVFRNTGERRVHRNEDDGFRELDSWPPPPPVELFSSSNRGKPYSQQDSGRHRRDRSGERGGVGGGRFHNNNNSSEEFHSGRRGKSHRGKFDNNDYHQEDYYQRKQHRGGGGGNSYHGRSSNNRGRDDYDDKAASYGRSSHGDWGEYSAPANLDDSGGGGNEPLMDPLLALELLKTAGLADAVLDPKRGMEVSSSPLQTPLYTSRGRRNFEGMDKKQQPAMAPTVAAASPTALLKGTVLMEGLPYEATITDILDFFGSYNLSYESVRIQCRDDGSPSGRAFVNFLDVDTAKLAVRHLNKSYVGGRYVELKLV